MPILPNQFRAWPDQHVDLDPQGLLVAYTAGWQGAFETPPEVKAELQAAFAAQTGYGSIGDCATSLGWADSGAGKLSVPFVGVVKRWANCWPAEAQTVGSCVSHSTKNALLLTLGCELDAAQPDPATGKLEGPPEVPLVSVKAGVLTNAPIYWARGYDGDGWSCGTAARVAVNEVGCVIARDYPDLGVDLTHTTRKNEKLYGSRKPPAEWQARFAEHRVRSSVEVNSFEELRDLLHNGYGVSSCGSEGFSSSRDVNGVSRRSGSWAHAMAYLAVDDRDVIKQAYDEPLVLVQNSWGTWNSGGRRIMGTAVDIPDGSFWARWSDVKRRDMYAFSNVAGWPAQRLPVHMGFTFLKD